jgi:lysozyme family protein
MDERFERLVGELLEDEGGYIFDKNDPGGETNFGISKRSYPDLDIKNLTEDHAVYIYYHDWWLKYRWDRIDDDELAGELLDLGPNMGAHQVHKLLQRAAGKTRWMALKDDGILGPISIGVINSHPNVWWLTDRFRLEAIKFYLDLKRSKYLASWVRRSIS